MDSQFFKFRYLKLKCFILELIEQKKIFVMLCSHMIILGLIYLSIFAINYSIEQKLNYFDFYFIVFFLFCLSFSYLWTIFIFFYDINKVIEKGISFLDKNFYSSSIDTSKIFKLKETSDDYLYVDLNHKTVMRYKVYPRALENNQCFSFESSAIRRVENFPLNVLKTSIFNEALCTINLNLEENKFKTSNIVSLEASCLKRFKQLLSTID